MLATQYITKLRDICVQRWNKDFELIHGASEDDIKLLQEKFPQVPESLIALLKQVDGTYYCQYGAKELCIPFFGTQDVAYYLNSVEQILEQNGVSIAYIYGDPALKNTPQFLEGFKEVVGTGIDPFQPFSQMLHFSDCINNGGSSALYIDFNPTAEGVKGQIVRFLHDPDEFRVIAPSFDAFLHDCLEYALDSEFDFIEEEVSVLDLENFTERLSQDEPLAVNFAKNYLKWLENLYFPTINYVSYNFSTSDFDKFTDASEQNAELMLAVLVYANKTGLLKDSQLGKMLHLEDFHLA